MAKIKEIKAREILNAKGSLTIEVTVITDNGKSGRASSATGKEAVRYENVNLTDTKAIDNVVNVIAPKLIGKQIENQPEIDKIMIDLDPSGIHGSC
jgi:enolase